MIVLVVVVVVAFVFMPSVTLFGNLKLCPSLEYEDYGDTTSFSTKQEAYHTLFAVKFKVAQAINNSICKTVYMWRHL